MTRPERPDPRRPRTEREAELVAAAVSDDLTPAEAREYDALVAADPSLADEAAELRAVLDRLDAAPHVWRDVVPSSELTARVLAVPDLERLGPVAGHPTASSRRRRWPLLAAAAAALVLLGGVVGGLAAGLGQDDAPQVAAPPEGPPGTLGAKEPISFQQEPDGVAIDATLVAHTWGTETALTMSGFTPGDRYDVVLLGDDGRPQGSGSFLGSTVEIDCRLNTGLLREDVAAVEIRDAAGAVVASSDVPDVG